MTHTFHIPVMGTGFTIDTPLKVARYGISSVVSVGDDKLIEKVRRYYCERNHDRYVPISDADSDHRARRITEYLDLIERTVRKQILEMKQAPFEKGSELSKYFDLLDDGSYLKKMYLDMLCIEDEDEKRFQQEWLKGHVIPGSIDVNIMTKADHENSVNGEKLPREYSDAMAALRGFAKSSLNSSVVFSAGLNLHLYSYVAEFDDFYADERGESKKKIILKVSDFRSASVQAKILAKKGIWVSEYRVESGLNCGGHAFPTHGNLIGPILEEFKQHRKELTDSLYAVYRDALLEKNRVLPSAPPLVRLTAQGGVGTAAEHQFLIRRYDVDSVGWGSPFLLVPEATVVDDETLEKLADAGENDIYLSHASPLGVPFYNLRTSASEEMRRRRIEAGRPGSPCVSKYLAFNTEYGQPLCVASSAYQQRKLKEIKERNVSGAESAHERESILEKSCICRDLGDGTLLKYHISDDAKELTPAICPGPNLAYFSKICSLKEMIDHIYGRANVMDPAVSRSHFLINELKLYIQHLRELISEACARTTQKEIAYFNEFKQNLLGGIRYYEDLANFLREESQAARERFISDLLILKGQLEDLTLPNVPVLQAPTI